MRCVWDLPPVPRILECALEGLVSVNIALIEAGLVGSLYDSAVRYRWVKPGNGWDHALIVNARGWGDCKDVGAWRCAELRLAGVAAMPYVIKTGPHNYHVQLALPDGSVEDPSMTLINLRGQDARSLR